MSYDLKIPTYKPKDAVEYENQKIAIIKDKIPIHENIIINGFNLKSEILEVLEKYMLPMDEEPIADAIAKHLCEKMNIVQGEI